MLKLTNPILSASPSNKPNPPIGFQVTTTRIWTQFQSGTQATTPTAAAAAATTTTTLSQQFLDRIEKETLATETLPRSLNPCIE
jgi:hypothetical protein